ncbi:hypothetical protein F511_13069 [Dorcoceras hygrometricum]|uniref:Uncharacterized protein n=1 Tax=Dorcoceras hygrometricum TaxID=472368 RepID=A0A2Z7BB32_9LAMI|nr:hypothetical protein F511_13069 [Dorcoceras hygrometricum]
MGRVSSRREGQLPLHIGCDFTTLKLISVVIRSSAMGPNLLAEPLGSLAFLVQASRRRIRSAATSLIFPFYFLFFDLVTPMRNGASHPSSPSLTHAGRRLAPPRRRPPLIDRTCSDQFFEDNPSVLISSGLLVQADEGVSLPVMDLIDVIYRRLP